MGVLAEMVRDVENIFARALKAYTRDMLAFADWLQGRQQALTPKVTERMAAKTPVCAVPCKTRAGGSWSASRSGRRSRAFRGEKV